MLKYLVAASMALVIAALVSYAVLATMGNECSSGNALPKFLSQSDPNAPSNKLKKRTPEKREPTYQRNPNLQQHPLNCRSPARIK